MFGEDLKSARKRIGGITQEDLAQAIAAITKEPITRQSVQKWEANQALPERDRWAAIEKVLALPEGWVYSAIDRDRQSQTATASSNSQAVNASNGAVVTISNGQGSVQKQGEVHASLTPHEYEVLILFRKYGNPTLLNKCLRQLRDAEAIFG